MGARENYWRRIITALSSIMKNLKLMFVESKKKEKGSKPPKEKPKSFQEQLIDMQKQQIEVFERSETNFQTFQLSMFQKQLDAEAKEKEKDRDFFLKFGKMLTGSTSKSSKNDDKNSKNDENDD